MDIESNSIKIYQISLECDLTIEEKSSMLIKENELVVVKEWSSVLEISSFFNCQRTAFDQALRKFMKSRGYYWIFKTDWDLGKRPNLEKRRNNVRIYAYTYSDKGFIGRFKNAVDCSQFLEISVSNIRIVAQGEKKVHKGYYFSYYPLHEGEDVLADIQEARMKALQNEIENE